VQQDRFYSPAQCAEPTPQRPVPSLRWRRIGTFVVILALGVLLCSAPMRSLGDTPTVSGHIFLYNGDGTATEVTSYVFYVGTQAYIYPNNPITVTLDYEVGHVYDPFHNEIGYITQDVPPSGGN